MKEQFLDCEYSEMLRELGFNGECLAYYSSDKSANDDHENISRGEKMVLFIGSANYGIKAPLYQQAEQWLWEELRCYVVVSSDGKGKFGFGEINPNVLDSPIVAKREAIKQAIWQLHQELKK